MKVTLSAPEDQNRSNGYMMPVFSVQASDNITVINRGWNEYECEQEIDESSLHIIRDAQLLTDVVHIEVKMPNGKQTCFWYRILPQSTAQYHALKETGNITW